MTESNLVYVEKTNLVEKKLNLSKKNERYFLKGTLTKEEEGSAVVEVSIENQKISIPLELVVKSYNKESIDENDMTLVSQISKVDLLHNMLNRYKRKEIHTYVGETLLIINPYEDLEIYNEKYMKSYISYFRDKLIVENCQQPAPHVYNVLMKMMESLTTDHIPQALVISGESGAGKTETAKHAMKMFTFYFENLDDSNGGQKQKRASLKAIKRESIQRETFLKKLRTLTNKYEVPLEDKILACNPILESFGNCKTVRNDNSSRFGKYTKLYVDLHCMEIVGAHISTYLLEKSRVTFLSAGERNYHIFYQLISGLTKLYMNDQQPLMVQIENISIKDKLEISVNLKLKSTFEILNLSQLKLLNSKDPLTNIKAFKYLNSDIYEISSNKNLSYDAEEFNQAIVSLLKTDFEPNQIVGIINLLAVILHLGNIKFEINKEDTNNNSCNIKDSTVELETICDILRLEQSAFTEALLNSSRSIQGKKIISPLNLRECLSNRDSLSKELYQRIFNLINSNLNSMLMSDVIKEKMASKPDRYSYLGFLDIFGFETFVENYFEQFCINYANEKLHQLYVNDIFKENERLFKQEGLEKQFKQMPFTDNQKVIDLLDKHPTGVFYLLDNECNVKGKDSVLLENICQIETKLNKSIDKFYMIIRKSLQNGKFTFKHTAKSVEYNIEEFVEKNLDDLGSLIKDVLSQVKRDEINKILKFETPSWPKYLGGKFRTNLANLVEELKNSKCSYVRCIKPNEQKASGLFNHEMIYQQIQYLGVLDTIRIRQEGFSVRMKFIDFFNTFCFILKSFDKKDLINEKQLKDKCLELLNTLDPNSNSEQIIFGHSLIFVKQNYFTFLDKAKEKYLRDKSMKSALIAATWRSWRIQRYLGKLHIITPLLQYNFRNKKEQRRMKRITEKVVIIQRNLRRHVFGKNLRENFLAEINLLKHVIEKFKEIMRKTIFLKKLRRVKCFIRKLIWKNKVKRFKLIQAIVLEIISKAMKKAMNSSFGFKLTLIQSQVRAMLYKKKNAVMMTKVKSIRTSIMQTGGSKKIQTYFRMWLIMRRLRMQRKSCLMIQSWFRMIVPKNKFIKLKFSADLIKYTWIRHFYKNRVFHDQIKSQASLATKRIEKTKAITGNCLFEADDTLNQDRKYSEEEVQRMKCNYLSYSSISGKPFDVPKMNFFACVLQVEYLTVENSYIENWSYNLKELINKNLAANTPILTIELGSYHTTCLNSSGKVYSWGFNSNGQLFSEIEEIKILENRKELNTNKYTKTNNTNYTFQTPKAKPTKIDNMISIEDLFYTDHFVSPVPGKIRQLVNGEDYSVCATKDYQVIIAGNNNQFQLGVNESSNIFYPFNLTDYIKATYADLKDLKVKEVKTSGQNVFLVSTAGKIYLISNYRPNNRRYFPIVTYDIKSISNIVLKVDTIECGKAFTIILSTSGVLFGMGDNMYGQLGTGDFTNRKSPSEVSILKQNGIKTTQISCGFKHVVIKTSIGKVFTWGHNKYGQLGNGNYANSATPIPVFSICSFMYVSAGLMDTFIISDMRKLFHCGGTSRKNELVQFDYAKILPSLFANDTHEIIKIHQTWNCQMSVLYAIVSEVSGIKDRLKSNQKFQNIKQSISRCWNTKDIYSQFPEGVHNYLSEKHLGYKEVAFRKISLANDSK